MSDFCYSRPMLNRVMRQAEVMDRMIEAVGVDPVVVAPRQGYGWYAARSRCIACRNEAQCADWLRKSSTRIPAEYQRSVPTWPSSTLAGAPG